MVAPCLPTCNDSTYDYFVVAQGLEQCVAGVQRIEYGGFAPHWPARLLLRGDGRRNLTRQIVRPKHVAGALPDGPLPEPATVFTQPIEHTQPAIDTAAVAWYDAARREWESLIGTLPAFHAAEFRWRPATGPRAEPVADSSREATVWRMLAMRLDECRSLHGRADAASLRTVLRHLRRGL